MTLDDIACQWHSSLILATKRAEYRKFAEPQYVQTYFWIRGFNGFPFILYEQKLIMLHHSLCYITYYCTVYVAYVQSLWDIRLEAYVRPFNLLHFVKRIIKVINLLLCESTSSSLINQFACSLATSCFDSIMQNQSMNICEHQAVRHLSCATHIQQVRHCIRPWLTNYDSNSLSQSCIKLSSLLIIGTFCQLRFLGTKPCKIRCTHFCF